jgi:hypothetical protein
MEGLTTSRSHRLLIPVVVLGLGWTLAACGGGQPTETPTPSATRSAAERTATTSPTPSAEPSASPAAASPTPVPSADPALRGVPEAVARYYAAYNRLSQDPTLDPLSIYDVTLDPENNKAYAQLMALREARQHQVGNIVAEVETYIVNGDSTTSYIADVCVDTTGADIMDEEGQSVWTTGDARRTYATIWVEQMGTQYTVSEVQVHLEQGC